MAVLGRSQSGAPPWSNPGSAPDAIVCHAPESLHYLDIA